MCDICRQIQQEKQPLYQDDVAIAVFAKKGCTKGHIQVYPKKHYANYEEVPEEEIDHLFFVANFAASALFESMGAHGTNILVNDNMGNEHFTIDIIPRFQDDGLNFFWTPKKFSEAEMKDIEKKIKDQTFYLTYKPPEKPKTIDLDKEKPEEIKSSNNYLLKQLQRNP